ncbi:MAG: hypothetical protein M0P70_15715 [Desulfobulbaceae bacterium]|nr:hypothetical protein [Desulfobulbaceae bacterium]
MDRVGGSQKNGSYRGGSRVVCRYVFLRFRDYNQKIGRPSHHFSYQDAVSPYHGKVAYFTCKNKGITRQRQQGEKEQGNTR